VARYIELNPVRAGLVKKPGDYKWSSAHAHSQGKDDILVKVEPLAAIVDDWQDLLKTDLTEEKKEAIRRHERTGRPLGNASFLNRLEKMINRSLKKQKPGPKKKN
jgi:putative transposase